MRKLCRILVAAVILVGLSAGPAAAAGSAQGPHRPTGWFCEYIKFC